MDHNARRWLDEAISTELPVTLPAFTEQTCPWPQARLFALHLSHLFHCYLVFLPTSKDNSFTVEVGWSDVAQFPNLMVQLAMDTEVATAAAVQGGLRFRLGYLAQGTDLWWRFRRRSEAASAVKEALQLVRAHALPYLRIQAASRGIAWHD